MDFDAILDHVGQFGRFQKIVYFLITLPTSFCSMAVMSYIFTSYSVKSRCFIPGCDNSTAPVYRTTFNNFTAPNDASCIMFHPTESVTDPDFSCSSEHFTNISVSCDRHVYDQSVFTSTTVSEFDLVCERQWLRPLVSSLFMTGMIIGAFVFGIISDKFGRKPSFLVAVVLLWLGGVLTAFSQSEYMLLPLQVIYAIGFIAVYQTAFVIAIEFVGKEWRTVCGISISFVFACGGLLLALLAYFIREWRYLQLAVSIFPIVFLGYYWLIPESPLWLISQGKWDEVRDVVSRMESMNNRPVPPRLLQEHFKHAPSEYSDERAPLTGHPASIQKVGFIDLLKTFPMLKRTVIISINWIVSLMVFFGLNLNSSNLVGDVFLNYALLTVAEFPGYFFCLISMDRLGRKRTMVACLLVGGCSCVAAAFVPEDLWQVSLSLTLLGKFGVAGSFGLVYVYTAELYPTSVRNIAVGLASTVSRIVNISSPFVADLGHINPGLPLIIFGVLAFMAGILSVVLPETLGRPLPQTMDDALAMEGYPLLACCECPVRKQEVARHDDRSDR